MTQQLLLKVTLKYLKMENHKNFAIFTIDGLTETAGYFVVDSSYVSGSIGGTFADGADVVITFARTGDIGPIGSQGVQGVQGDLGFQGISGEGNQGVQGVQGLQGVQGSDGLGIQGGAGPQGFTGFPRC